MASVPKSLVECAERLDAAQTAVNRSHKIAGVAVGVISFIGLLWAGYELLGRKPAALAGAPPEPPPSPR